MNPRYSPFRRSTFFLLLFCATSTACLNTRGGRPDRPISLAIVVDPTTEFSLNNGTDDPVAFLDQTRAIVRERVVTKLRPNDDLTCVAVTSNSSQFSDAIVLEFPSAMTAAEQDRFLTFRNQAAARVEKWFVNLRDAPPCKDPTKHCSDIFGSMILAASSLRRTPEKQKLLLVLSDLQENIRGPGSIFAGAFESIDVVVLYAFPKSRKPSDYEPFRQAITKELQKGNPRSIKVLFPAESPTFDLEDAIGQLRRYRDV